jgi:hypothetical protein
VSSPETTPNERPVGEKRVRVLAWFSHGACSAVATKLALEKYGPDIEIVSIDPGRESDDNPRFRAACEEWFDHEIKVIRSEKYVDHIDVAKRTGYINGPAGARCTAELKKAVRHAYERPDDLHVWGYASDKRDFDRATNFALNNPVTDSWFPLIERNLYKRHCLAMVERTGITLPEMYRKGYVNNNCIGCWKGGKGYWNKIREDFPEVFAEAAAVEREKNHSAINGTFLDELEPGTGRYKPEEIACDLNCQTVENEWVPVTIAGAA